MHEASGSPLTWRGEAEDGALSLLDQRLLPAAERWGDYRSVDEVAAAIRDMTVRGAPAIGLTAAYGMVLAAQRAARLPADEGRALLAQARALLAATRPTAVNLFWALEAMAAQATLDASPAAMLARARALHDEDVAGNERIGRQLQEKLKAGANVLTHCNAGALATGGLGTALSGLFLAKRAGLRFHVWVSETRPRLQGARLTAYELTRAGIDCTLIADNMSSTLMRQGRVDLVVTGADRIAANGDVANKIGTSMHATLARVHGVPFYVAAPRSTFDLSLASGASIPIEERSADEVTTVNGERLCPPGMKVFNPSFDVTPAADVRALFTDRGEIAPVTTERIAQVLGRC